MTRIRRGHLVATWPDGTELYRCQDDYGGGSMSMVFRQPEDHGHAFVDVPYPERRRSPFHAGIWFYSGPSGEDREANDLLQRRTLWFARETGLLSPVALAGGAPVHVASSDLSILNVLVPGRLPASPEDWIREVDGCPTTREEAEDLVSRTIPAWTGRERVSAVVEPGGDRINTFLVPLNRTALEAVRPWAGMIETLSLRVSSLGDRPELLVDLSPFLNGGGGRGSTLARAIWNCFRTHGFLFPHELEQWFSLQELPGALVGGEGLEIARILGNPCPLLAPWPEFLAQREDS